MMSVSKKSRNPSFVVSQELTEANPNFHSYFNYFNKNEKALTPPNISIIMRYPNLQISLHRASVS